eukprot:COSAG01_NODE_35863_length_525_cov_1.892019_1_plen_47_part_01
MPERTCRSARTAQATPSNPAPTATAVLLRRRGRYMAGTAHHEGSEPA